MINENVERFEIHLVDHTLPFGVKAGPPSVISINDNDSKCFELIMYAVLYLLHTLHRINMHTYVYLLLYPCHV